MLTADQISPTIRAALDDLNWDPASPITSAGSAASGRTYWRVQIPTGTRIIQVNPTRNEEVERFIDTSRALADAALPVARIHAIGARQLLMDDLGSTQLCNRIATEGPNTPALEETVRLIRRIQATAPQLETAIPWLSDRRFDAEHLLWETEYFRDNCWIPRLSPDALEIARFNDAREALAQRVLDHPQTIVHRDFQGQNVLFPEQIAFIDHQGARIGSIFYDLASLIFDPYVQLPESRIIPLFNEYCRLHPIIDDPETAWPLFLDAAAQRIMQANGAYGFLTDTKGLATYEQWKTPGWQQLERVLKLHSKAWGDSVLTSTVLI